MTKSQILTALNRTADADAARKKAFSAGTAVQLYSAGRQVHLQGKKAEAMEMYKMVVAKYPDHWAAHLAKSRLDVAAGDFAGALKEIQAAVEGSPEVNKSALRALQKRIENKEDINA
jgi:tetratricopeptide (TPR) repeat protein